jgi:stage II sporulation protein D
MSQYGANDLGKAGSTYAEILSHFYPGAQILSLGKGG